MTLSDEEFEEALKKGAERLRMRGGPEKLVLADAARQRAGSQVNIKCADAEEASAAFCILYKYFQGKAALDKARTAAATDGKRLQLELANGSCVVCCVEGDTDA